MTADLLVHAFPQPRLRYLALPARETWLSSDTYGFGSGRAATYWAFRGLDRRRWKTAWMPEHHCGVEVQAAIDAGFDVQFYRVLPDLSIDEQDLEHQLRATAGPVLLIHYFGFPQPGVERIARLCSNLGVPLIEDCAHALFSSMGDSALGSFGSISVFSFRKSLPLYDGGGLRVADMQFIAPSPPRGSREAYVAAVKQAAKGLLGARGTAIIGRLRRSGEAAAPVLAAWDEQKPSYSVGFSALSRRIATACDPGEIIRARRQNWERVHTRLAGVSECRPVWDRLDQGVCPLFHCLWVRNRDALMQRLAAKGVETFRFGAHAHPLLDLVEYPGSQVYRDEILAFPVHQDLSPQALDRALESFVAEVSACASLT